MGWRDSSEWKSICCTNLRNQVKIPRTHMKAESTTPTTPVSIKPRQENCCGLLTANLDTGSIGAK